MWQNRSRHELKRIDFWRQRETASGGGAYRDSIQAWLPIKNIISGVVITRDNRFIKILEVLPVNIYLKSPNDWQNIISSYAAYLKIAPDDLQLEARTLPADTADYVERMKKCAETNESCREMIEDNIKEIGQGIASDAIRHRFFLVFRYEARMKSKGNSVAAIIQRLNEEADTARRYLDVCELAGYGYSTTVGSCWLTPLVEAGEGVNLIFTAKRQPKDKILSKIAQTTMVNRSRMRDVGDTRQDYEELDSAISSGLYLKDAMNRQGEDFYYMHTLIEVVADDAETLEQRVTAVEKLCVSIDMIARRCDYKNEQAFLSALPLLALDADVERKSRRNALTSGVAEAFPFASYELSDRNGVFLGLNLYNRSPVFLDPYDDYKYTNGNCWIGGSSGAGKTFTLQCLGGRLRQQGRRVIFIVPKKGHEFRPLCELLGGLYLKMSPSSKDCPNIMAIRRKSLDAYSGLRDLAVRDDSVLADKISRLIIWYSLQKRDLSDEDKNHLDSSLVECYRRYGITFDNDTVTDTDGQFREMPVIADWYNVLQESADTKHLAVVLARYVTGSASAMGARNDIDLDNKYIVLDTSGMPDDLLLPGIFWATDIANDLIMDAGSDLSALIADELWSLVGANSNPLAAGFVQEMVKTIRGLGGIAVTSTQGMQDLFGLDGGKYGKGILDSSRIKLVMQMEEQEARLIQGVLNLSEDDVRQITRFRRGEGLLCIGYNHVPIAFHATQKEYDAITTSPTDLRVRRRGGAE